MHVHKKLERNENEDGNNHKSLWQGEWNHFLAFVLCKIVPYLERQLSLHVLSLLKHVTPNLYKSDWEWQHPPQYKKLSLVMTISICFRVWWKKGEKPFSVHEFHSLMQSLQWYLEAYHGLQCTHSRIGNITNGYPNH
jgi:hypothetical protein